MKDHALNQQDQVTISGLTTINGTVFGYNEEKFGTNRGITIWRVGVQNDRHSYKLNPNPHNDNWYNKHQSKFYKHSAIEIGSFQLANGNYPPFNSDITVHDITYTLQQP